MPSPGCDSVRVGALVVAAIVALAASGLPVGPAGGAAAGALDGEATLTQVAQLGGRVTGMVTSDGVAWVEVYRSEGSSYVALDLQNLPELATLATVPYDRLGEIVAAQGSLLYTVVGDRLMVVDASLPERPTAVGQLPLPGPPVGAIIFDRLLFTVVNGAVIQIDLTEPTRPTLLGQGPSLGLGSRLATDGRYVFAAWSEGYRADPHSPFRPSRLYVIDAADPDRLDVTGSAELPWMADIHNPASITQLVWKDGFVLAGTDGSGDSLAVFDVRAPQTPALVASLPAGRVQALLLDGDRLLLVDGQMVRTVDVSSPSAPRELAQWRPPDPWQSVASAELVDGRLLIADWHADVRVVDLRSPEGPHEVAAFRPPNQIHGLVVRDDILITTGYRGDLRTFDVADPARPRPLGFLAGSFFGHQIALVDDVAYVAAHSFGLRLADVGEPSHPVPLSVITTIPFPLGMEVRGTTLFVVGRDGLYALDVTQAERPMIVGRLAIDRGYWLRLAENVAYVTGESGLTVVDIEDPARLRLLGALGVGTAGFGPELFGHILTAIIGFSDHEEVNVIDVARPARPVLVANHAFAHHVQETGSIEGYLVIAYSDGGNDLAVIDLADVHRLVTVATAPNVDARAVASVDDVVYAGTYYDGLRVYRFVARATLTPGVTVAPTPTPTPTQAATGTGPRWFVWLPWVRE